MPKELASLSSATQSHDHQQQSLIQNSDGLIADTASQSILSGILKSKPQRVRLKRLKDAALRETENVHETILEKAKENLRLTIAVNEQTHVDESRIEHRNNMEELARVSEAGLRQSLLSLYQEKKLLAQKFSDMPGDVALKAIAIEVLCAVTDNSAHQLINRNTKPR